MRSQVANEQDQGAEQGALEEEQRGVASGRRPAGPLGDQAVVSEGQDPRLHEIESLARVRSLAGVARIGELILALCADGGGARRMSLARRAALEARGLGRSSVHRAIALHELLERQPELRATRHLTPTHVRAVSGLAHPLKLQLLIVAERDRWTTSRLEREAGKHRSGGSGRPRCAPSLAETLEMLVFESERGAFAGVGLQLDGALRPLAQRVLVALRPFCAELDRVAEPCDGQTDSSDRAPAAEVDRRDDMHGVTTAPT